MRQNRPTYEIMLDTGTDAVAVLYQRYGRKLFGYGSRTWKLNEDDNWDLVYKTLYKVCEKIGQYDFDSEKGFSAVVYKIYINYLRKHYRKQQQIGEHLQFSNFNESLFEETGENRGLKTEKAIKQRIHEKNLLAEKLDEIPENPKLSALEDELDKLEDWQRMLLLLKSQNMPYKEIANYIDKPPQQLKVYYQRLKSRIVKKLNERLDDQKLN